MGCQIQLSDSGEVEISNPNGEPSFLYSQIKNMDSVRTEKEAVNSWLKVYSPTYKEWFGEDWENLSESKKDQLVKDGILSESGEPVMLYSVDFMENESPLGNNSPGTALFQSIDEANSFANSISSSPQPVLVKASKIKSYKDKEELRSKAKDSNINDLVNLDLIDNDGIRVSNILGNTYVLKTKDSTTGIVKGKMQNAATRLITEAEVGHDENSREKLRSDEFIRTVAASLAKNLGLNFGDSVVFIDAAEARIITKDSENPYQDHQKAFFYKGKVYFVKGKVSYDVAFHEFAHIFIKAIASDNPELLNIVYNDLIKTKEGLELLNEALKENPTLDAKGDDIVQETIVKAMTKSAVEDNLITDPASSGFIAAIKKLFYALKQLFRKISKRSTKDLGPNTTIKELSKMLIEDSWDIDMEVISQSEIVSYASEQFEMKSSARERFNSEEGLKSLIALLRELRIVSRKQLESDEKNPNKEYLQGVISTRGGQPIQQSMLNRTGMISKAAMEKSTAEDYDETKFTEETLSALVNSLEDMYIGIDKMSNDIENLKNHPDEQYALMIANDYYAKLSQYETYLKRFKGEAKSYLGKSSDKIIQMPNSMLDDIEGAKTRTLEIVENAVKETLFEQYNPLNKKFKEIQEEQIKLDKERLASGKIDARGTKFLTERIEKLTQMMNDIPLTKDDLLMYAKGKMGDVTRQDAYLESYIMSSDPSIASFAKFIKGHMAEVNVEVMRGQNEFLTEMDDLLKAAGLKFNEFNKISEATLFLDKSYKIDEKTGEMSEEMVHTLLNEYKNHKYTLAKFDQDRKLAEKEYDEDKTPENKKKLEEASKKQKHLEDNFFVRPYIDEFYEAAEILKSPLGIQAEKEKREAIANINAFQETNTKSQVDDFVNQEVVNKLWRENYNILFSLYKEDGITKKEGDELKKAELLIEHRNVTREFYNQVLRADAFNNAYHGFVAKETAKLVDLNMDETSPAFKVELNKGVEKWISANTVQRAKPEYHESRNVAFNHINELLEKRKVKAERYYKNVLANNSSTKEQVDQATEMLAKLKEEKPSNEEIRELMAGKKDQNSEFVAIDTPEAVLKRIYEIDKEVSEGRTESNSASGLQSEDKIELKQLVAKEKSKSINEEEAKRLSFLRSKSKELSLSTEDAKKLADLFSFISASQSKKFTKYYDTVLNSHVERLAKNMIVPGKSKGMGERELDAIKSNIISSSEYAEARMAEDEKFKKWFLSAHIKKSYTDSNNVEIVTYNATSAWKVTTPSSISNMESFEIVDKDNLPVETIYGAPTMEFYDRKIKDEYKTGYNKATGIVDFSKQRDVQGNKIPYSYEKIKSLRAKNPDRYNNDEFIFDQFINHQYLEVKKNDSARHALIEGITKFHLKHQEGLEKGVMLGLEFPRFRRGIDEVLASTSKDKLTEKLKRLQSLISSGFKESGDNAEDNLNYKLERLYNEMEVYRTDTSKVPIRGKYRIDEKDVSMDVSGSILNYYRSSVENKRLVEISPTAIAMKRLAVEEDASVLNGLGTKIAKRSLLTKEMPATGRHDSNRNKVLNSMVELVFEGKRVMGAGSNNVALNKSINTALAMASHSFFAFDVTSALKNYFGALFQTSLEAATGKYFNYADYYRGKPWAMSAMYQMTSQAYSTDPKTLDVQLLYMFDAIQDMSKEDFGTTQSRSVGRDFLKFNFPTSHRKFLEREATIEIFSAFMHSERVEQYVDGKMTEIRYVNAWELDSNNQVKLKEGIDSKWDLNGSEFKRVMNANHEISNQLQGAYAVFDQPMVSRFVGANLVGSMRKFFTKMFLKRFGYTGDWRDPQERRNIATTNFEMGYYLRNYLTLRGMVKSGFKNIMYLTKEEKRALILGAVELLKLWMISLLMFFVFGYDDDDPEKWKKLKAKSGAMPWMGLTDEEWSKDWNFGGWASNQALYLLMHIEAENEHFIPTPKHGLKDMFGLFSSTSISAAASVGTMITLFDDIINTTFGYHQGYYKRDVGALNTQQEGANKFWVHLQKLMGVKGKWIDPVSSIRKFRGYRTK